MDLLQHLLSDPGTPRVTVYDKDSDFRMDFSATTLDNWVAKVANMLRDECDLVDGDAIVVDLPAGWPAVVITLGAYALGITVDFTYREDNPPQVVFTTLDRLGNHLPLGEVDPRSFTNDTVLPLDDVDFDVAVVSTHPWGRGVAECGDPLPEGLLDFFPLVRVYGDTFPEATPTLSEVVDALVTDTTVSEQPVNRLVSGGFTDYSELLHNVMLPLAAGGSVVLVTGLTDVAELEKIAATEHGVVARNLRR